MAHLEIEYKVMIENKLDFEKIIDYFKNHFKEIYDQTNYYFDTKDELLKKYDVSLRIRNVNNKYIATLKETTLKGKLEYEEEISNCNNECFANEIESILKKYHVNKKDLICLASLKTIRFQYQIDDKILCLDHNFYNNIEDYEVECECNNLKNAKEYVNNLLDNLNIPYKVSKYSKVARAKRSKKQL